jgi:hypothetical protein
MLHGQWISPAVPTNEKTTGLIIYSLYLIFVAYASVICVFDRILPLECSFRLAAVVLRSHEVRHAMLYCDFAYCQVICGNQSIVILMTVNGTGHHVYTLT